MVEFSYAARVWEGVGEGAEEVYLWYVVPQKTFLIGDVEGVGTEVWERWSLT